MGVRGGGQIGLPVGERVPWRGSRQRQSECESKISLLGTRKGVSLSILVPRTTCPLSSSLSAICACRTGRACHLSRQREAQSASARAASEGEDDSYLSTHSSGWLPVTGASLPFLRSKPSTIWPQMLEFRKFYAHFAVHLQEDPLPCLSNLVPTYIFSFITCCSPELMTLLCSHSGDLTFSSFLMPLPLLASFSRKTTVFNSFREIFHCTGKKKHLYIFSLKTSLFFTFIILPTLHSLQGFRLNHLYMIVSIVTSSGKSF